MTQIDERFLRPHPRTMLWQEQRKKCEVCANLVNPAGDPTAMRCSATKITDVMDPQHVTRFKTLTKTRPEMQVISAFCIDAREPTAPCGPDAILFRLSLPQESDATENSTVGKADSSQKGT